MLLMMIAGVIGMMLVGVPVAFALALSTAAFFIAADVPLTSFVQMALKGVDAYTLLALPFFIFTAKLMNAGGATHRLLDLGNACVGFMRGGLGQANILASFMFAGISGSAVADAGGLGAVEIEAMRRAGHSQEFATGVTAASATVGPIIPPSIVMIVYGIAAGVPVGALFLGGILPGIIMALAMMVMVAVLSRRETGVQRSSFRWSLIAPAGRAAAPSLMTPVIVVGGILAGASTATESGAIAAAYALVVGMWVHRELSLRDVWLMALETMRDAGAVLIIMAMANAFAWALAYQQAPQAALDGLLAITDTTLGIFLLLTLVFLILGCFIEAIAIITMTVPVVMPVLAQAGIDPVHFGVVLALTMSIGTITPPLGIVMFAVCRVTNLSIERYTRLIIPWIVLLISVTLLIVVFPQLVLWIPNAAGLG